MIKLSELQQDIINKMANGWELGRAVTLDGRYWLQKGKLCEGGEVVYVNKRTAYALYKKGLIEWELSGNVNRAALTQLGIEQANKESK